MSAGLVGRDADVEALAELLSRERLVEVIGPGGIGKTAVALDVGRRLLASGAVDAVWLARLENTVTRADVVDVLIAALHGPGSEAALFERLRTGSALVILDNCEHVVEVAADLAVRLLDHAPDLRILCTSQLPLEIDGNAWSSSRPSSCPMRSSCSDVAPRGSPARRATTSACSSCVGPSTACRWPSSSRRRAPGP